MIGTYLLVFNKGLVSQGAQPNSPTGRWTCLTHQPNFLRARTYLPTDSSQSWLWVPTTIIAKLGAAVNITTKYLPSWNQPDSPTENVISYLLTSLGCRIQRGRGAEDSPRQHRALFRRERVQPFAHTAVDPDHYRQDPGEAVQDE